MADVRAMLREARAARQQPPPPKGRKRKAADQHRAPEPKRNRTEDASALSPGFFDSDVAEPTSASAPPPGLDSDVAEPASAWALPPGFFDSDVAKPASASALPAGFFDSEAAEPASARQHAAVAQSASPAHDAHRPPPPARAENGRTSPPVTEAQLEAELEELDRALMMPSPPPGTVIYAPAMNAAEMAAQKYEQHLHQGWTQEEEMAQRDADAAEDSMRQLEDHFEIMDELYERLRKLQEQREALRPTAEQYRKYQESKAERDAPSKPDKDAQERTPAYGDCGSDSDSSYDEWEDLKFWPGCY